MQWVPQKSAADLENRAAFLVQLRALLLQAKHILGESQKGKLKEIQASVEEWVKEVGEVGAPRPSIFTPPSGTPLAQSTNPEQQQQVQADSVEMNGDLDGSSNNNKSFSNALQASGSAIGVSAGLPPRADELSSFTVNMLHEGNSSTVSGSQNEAVYLSSYFETRNLEDFAEFLRMFFSSGLQETVKLRNVGRNAARLSIVRCFSIITNALQQVVREMCMDTRGTDDSDGKGGCGENCVSRSSLFVHISRDIGVSTNATLKFLDLLTAHSDFFSTRLGAQVCVDVLKQLRQCLVLFEQRFLREEMRHLRAVGDSSTGHGSTAETVNARCVAQRRLEELRVLLGPALITSIVGLMDLVRPAVRYLISVAALKDTVGSQEERTVKDDVCANLFSLAQWVSTTARSKRRKRQSLSDDAAPNEKDLDTTREPTPQSGMLRSGSLPDLENATTSSPLWHHVAAHYVVDSLLPIAFSPEYISCIAQHCGDQSNGQIVAVQILNDTVKKLAETDVEELRYVLGLATWRRRIAEGVLNCIVSLQTGVLRAGLNILNRIVVRCPEYLGSEIGFLYTSGIFGLLETDSTPSAMRRALLEHVVNTFFRSSNANVKPSLLLRLYYHFDLNVHWHQLNVVQQAVATLSKAVRCAAPEDFADAEEQETESENSTALQKSLPFLALQGLSLAVELLTMYIPQEKDVATTRQLTRLPNRERKMEEQRLVDVINSSPVKGVKKLFHITDEDMNLDGRSDAAERDWAHQHIPPPASQAAEEKVRQITQFLMETPSLNPESVAEFLSHPSILTLQICQCFMDALPLAGKSIVAGLRELFKIVLLPKEGQRIERLLEFFSSAYYRANSVEGVDVEVFPFESENACFIVSIAVLMLNTNLYNPHVSSAKVTASTFHSQLRGCNEEKDFSERFTHNIFDEISLHSLNSMKGFWSAGMHSGARYATVPLSGKMDSIFFSSEERRELAFGVVRQRLASETQELLCRHSSFEVDTEAKPPTFWCSIAQDLFLSTWPSLCVVFGVALHGSHVPEEALLLCVRGLRSSFLVAAAFGLQTECGVSQHALLRMASFELVRNLCNGCVLEIAATVHSVNFSARLWAPVVELLVDIRKQPQKLLVEAESVFGRMEEFTRASSIRTGDDDDDDDDDVRRVFTCAVEEMLHGITTIMKDTSMDESTLAAVLYVLRRALGYSFISHEQHQGAVVKNLINVRDLSEIIIPVLIDVVDAGSGKGDEYLHTVMEFVVDILASVWNTCICDTDSKGFFSQSEIAECFVFFQQCYERCKTHPVVLMHILQGIKELVSRTMHAVGSTWTTPVGFYSEILFIMSLVWQRVLQPLASTLCEKNSVGTETCSLAVHVLRKLIVLICGDRSTTLDIQFCKKARTMLLLLLSNVTYIGGMCGDADSAQSCLAHFSTICTTALNDDTIISSEDKKTLLREDGNLKANNTESKRPVLLLQRFVDGVEKQPDILVLHSLERLCLLLRCQAQQTRTEVITLLRALVIQLKLSQLQHLALHLSNTVLEASLGHATPEQESSMTDPALLSFILFDLRVPSMMRRCSLTSFRATLPPVMNFMSHELLSEVPPEHLDTLVSFIMKHCMVPMVVSSRSTYQVRTIAVRSLMQCASFSITSQPSRRGSTKGLTSLCSVAECVSFILFALCVPARLLVPANADYVGRQWLQEEKSEVLGQYRQAAADAAQLLWGAEAYEITGGHSSTTIFVEEETSAALDREEFSQSLRGSWISSHSDVVTDEQLVEYCTLMAQLLSPLPKILEAAPFCSCEGENDDDLGINNNRNNRVSMGNGSGDHGDDAVDQQQGWQHPTVWTPPPVDLETTAELILETAGTFFAILWRVNHFVEMEIFVARSIQKGRDAPPLSKSNALLPHAAIRGALNAYLVLALRGGIDKLHGVMVEILRGTAVVQRSTLSRQEAKKNDGTVESLAMQRLSPREQQHMCSCNVGMYQELSSVVSHWIKSFIQKTDTEKSMLVSARRVELECIAKKPDIFLGLVRLLSVTAGTIIVPIRDYLTWYITAHHRGLEREMGTTSCEEGPVLLPPSYQANGTDDTDE